jgi:hypothetical protein
MRKATLSVAFSVVTLFVGFSVLTGCGAAPDSPSDPNVPAVIDDGLAPESSGTCKSLESISAYAPKCTPALYGAGCRGDHGDGTKFYSYQKVGSSSNYYYFLAVCPENLTIPASCQGSPWFAFMTGTGLSCVNDGNAPPAGKVWLYFDPHCTGSACNTAQ